MSRNYRSVRPKRDRVYSVKDVEALFRVSQNTVTNWVKSGLKPTDDCRPRLFRGAELKRFHDVRSLSNQRQLLPSEFKCTKCKTRVTPAVESIFINRPIRRAPSAFAVCPECGTHILKFLNETTCTAYEDCIKTNTSLRSIDEREGASQAGIVTIAALQSIEWNAENERIISLYQLYGGRYHEKTVDAHLSAIRDFEEFTGYAGFEKTTPTITARYREHLVRLANEAGMSRSVLRHRVSYLRQFFTWLLKQEGFRRLNHTLIDNLELSKKETARAIQPDDRNIPTREEVLKLISAMPANTLLQRRDRAVVAMSVEFGTRAAATASLTIGNVDIENRKVYQDATRMRVKNSKSQETCWFGIDGPFAETITSWITELLELGATPDAPVAMPDEALLALGTQRAPYPIKPWQTEEGIRRAFRRGYESADLPYFNPHSIRHYLAAEAETYCRSARERHAWSHNLGHSKPEITQSHYNKMNNAERDTIFSQIGKRDSLTEDDKDLLIQLYESRLYPGTPEYERAIAIRQKRFSTI